MRESTPPQKKNGELHNADKSLATSSSASLGVALQKSLKPSHHLMHLMLIRPTQIISMLAIAGYLAAAALPCPIQAAPAPAAGAVSYSHTNHDHSVHDHSVETETVAAAKAPPLATPFLSEPCPCGCQGKSGGTLSAKRLGRVIPSEIESVAIAQRPATHTPLLQAAPEFAAAPPEPVPILS